MRDLFDFIDSGVSPYHAVCEAAGRLEQSGFMRLEESGVWDIRPGGRYFTTRNQSSIIAFVLPEKEISAYHMTASHSDSPTFRIKRTKMEDKYYARAETEGYGGMIMSSWMDRPLSLAGRAVIRTPEGIRTELIAPDRDLFVIPNLSIHFNRDVNKGYTYNQQTDIQPLYGSKEADLMEIIAEETAVSRPEDILDTDFVLVVRQKAGYVGTGKEFYMAPRIDDLACAYTSLQGFLRSLQGESTNVENIAGTGDMARIWCMFDNEEVGSGTRQGAMGAFLPEVLGRVEEAFHMSREDCARARSRSLMVSADNAHALHPNYPSKSDPEFPVILNQGIVIKYNASQKYTTTGMTAAVFSELCKKNDIPLQRFANRGDMPGGSTLGNLLSHQLSIPMLDIGLPQLAMHSAVETAGCADAGSMIQAVRAFYQSGIRQERDGVWSV